MRAVAAGSLGLVSIVLAIWAVIVGAQDGVNPTVEVRCALLGKTGEPQ